MKKSILLVAIAAVTLASCTKEANTPVSNKIQLESAVTATKAVVGSTNYSFSATLVGDNGALFVEEVATITNGATIGTGVEYPAIATPHKFYALAPVAALTADKATGTIAIDGTKDVMYAATGSFTTNTDMVNRKLTFNHMLTQLQFKVEAESQPAIDRWGTVTSVSLMGQPSTINIDVKTGLLTSGTNFMDFTTVNTPLTLTMTAQPLAGPEPVLMTVATANSIAVKVITSKYPNGVSGSIPAPVDGFAVGKSHVVTIKLNATVGIILDVPTVSPWVEGNTTDVAIN